MLRVWLAMQMVGVCILDMYDSILKFVVLIIVLIYMLSVMLSKLSSGDMSSGSHWDSICSGATAYHNMRHDQIRDVMYRAYVELEIRVQREPTGAKGFALGF